jgi:DNA-binding transcriptional ArsR family regulator
MRRIETALDALGDPTRRAIFERLAERPRPVGELAAGMPVSRPAVSQHLRVLKEAGLVSETADGAKRIYRLDPRGIGAVREWLDEHWTRALDAFVEFADAQEALHSDDQTENPETEKPEDDPQ